mgnify:FL=1
MADGPGVLVYPCLYGWPSGYNPIPAELAAGLALNYHSQGADGIYLFNWFPHTKNNSENTGPWMTALVKQIGDPEELLRSQQQLMFAADRGRPQRAYQYNWLHCILPATLPTEDPLAVTMRVFAELSSERELKLRLAVDNLQDDDKVAVTLNATPVTGGSRTERGLLKAVITVDQLRVGDNEFELHLVNQAATSDQPRTVTALELFSARN